MQKKFGTVLNEKVLSQARSFCQQEHTTISHLLEIALVEYLKNKERRSLSSFSTVEASFGMLKLHPQTLKDALEEDIYETP